MSFKKRYRDLEVEVYSALRTIVEQSDKTSEQGYETNVIDVRYLDYLELGIVDGSLVLICDRGLTTNVTAIPLEDLIDFYEDYLGL